MNARTNFARTVRLLAAIAVVLAPAVATAAEIDRTFPLASGGEVDIEIPEGRLTVRGWDRDEVRLTGRLEGAPDRVELDASESVLRIEIEPGGRSVLELTVPRLSSLGIEAIACDVTIEGVRAGNVDIEIVHGDIEVDAEMDSIGVEAVSGEVELRGRIGRVEVDSAAGRVDVTGVTRVVEIESVSGPLRVEAVTPLQEATLSSASGGIRFTGGIERDGRLRAESLNGNVELELDASTAADFEIETFNGDIEVDWEGVELRGYRSGVDRHASFTLGGGGAQVDVETFNGRCIIRKR